MLTSPCCFATTTAMTTITVDKTGHIIIPKDKLEALGIKPGDTFTFENDLATLTLTPVPKEEQEYRRYWAINYTTNEGIYKDGRRELIL